MIKLNFRQTAFIIQSNYTIYTSAVKESILIALPFAGFTLSSIAKLSTGNLPVLGDALTIRTKSKGSNNKQIIMDFTPASGAKKFPANKS